MPDVKEIARVCHEAYRGVCAAAGDTEQPAWLDAEQWQRDSMVRGVEAALARPLASARDLHNAWVLDQLSAGWTYGKTRSAEARTHPSLVPFEQLPLIERAKDYVFRAVVDAMV
ncbi:MAG: RyR domain-containing protein [Janthinobacterium lividum]